jgi:hypothetical protein
VRRLPCAFPNCCFFQLPTFPPMCFAEEGGRQWRLCNHVLGIASLQITTPAFLFSHFPHPRVLIGLTRHDATLARETSHLGCESWGSRSLKRDTFHNKPGNAKATDGSRVIVALSASASRPQSDEVPIMFAVRILKAWQVICHAFAESTVGRAHHVRPLYLKTPWTVSCVVQYFSELQKQQQKRNRVQAILWSITDPLASTF